MNRNREIIKVESKKLVSSKHHCFFVLISAFLLPTVLAGIIWWLFYSKYSTPQHWIFFFIFSMLSTIGLLSLVALPLFLHKKRNDLTSRVTNGDPLHLTPPYLYKNTEPFVIAAPSLFYYLVIFALACGCLVSGGLLLQHLSYFFVPNAFDNSVGFIMFVKAFLLAQEKPNFAWYIIFSIIFLVVCIILAALLFWAIEDGHFDWTNKNNSSSRPKSNQTHK